MNTSAPAPEAVPAAVESDNPAATFARLADSENDDAWVPEWADGKSVITGLLKPNVVKTAAAVETLRIRTGNAGSLQVTVNGTPAGSLGPKGQVRVVEVTRDGFTSCCRHPSPPRRPLRNRSDAGPSVFCASR